MTETKKADHEIVIELLNAPQGLVGALPMVPAVMRVGETVSYSSTHGTFRLVFPDGSLFGYEGPSTITDSNVMTLVKEGKFECRCFVTPPAAEEIGWSPENVGSGGVHDVRV